MKLNLICMGAMSLFFGLVGVYNELFFYLGMDFFFMIWDYVIKWLFNVVLNMMDEEERDVFYRVMDDPITVIKDLNNLVKTTFNFNGVNEHYAMVQGDGPGNGNNAPGNGNNPPGNGNNGPGGRQGDSPRQKTTYGELALTFALGGVVVSVLFYKYVKNP